MPFGPLRYRAWTSGSGAAAEAGLSFGPLRYRAWTSGEAVAEVITSGNWKRQRLRPSFVYVEVREEPDVALGRIRLLSLASAIVAEPTDLAYGDGRLWLSTSVVVNESPDTARGRQRLILGAFGRASDGSDRALGLAASSWKGLQEIDEDDLIILDYLNS